MALREIRIGFPAGAARKGHMATERIMRSVHPDHVVQFYEDADSVLDAVSRFLCAGMEGGDASVVIATQAHREALERRLIESGLDVVRAREEGRYVALDAAETLSRFMVGKLPEERRFRDVVGTAVAEASAKASSRRVRAFGEMVALLCSEGAPEAAIHLERLWNELGKTHPFSLFCGYPMNLFPGEDQGKPFGEICAEHSRVVPTESYTTLPGPTERLRVIAELQQKANSLETETGQRKRVEQTLVRREKELSDFLENAVEGIHRVGPDGRILWANKAELDLLGYAEEEYVGHKISEFHADKDVIAEILRRLLSGETLYDHPARLRCKDGSIKHVRIHSNALWEDGKFVHTRCFTRDVTDRVRLEEELRQKLEELAETDRRKDEFLAMLGHELRNPLSPIVTAVQLMRLRGADPDLVARSVEVIDRQTQHMTRLIDDLLDVSRITRGTISLREESVALTTVVQGAVEQARPLMEERGHRFSLRLPSEAVSLRADPARLEQVLVNLLLNAAKYTEIGGRISLEAVVRNGELEISVRDNGIGLSPDVREKIFDLFVRSSDSGTHAPGGLGVGLTLVRRIVQLHGGSVEARSEGRGRGSEFVVRLPLRSSQIPMADSPDLGSKVPRSPEVGRRILVVDDNADAAEGLSDFLRALGHSVRTARDGASAIQEASRLRPEIVLLDIGLPDIDGHEVARRLRTQTSLRSSLFVALTGYGQERDRQLSREAGFDHHLVKPVDLGKLEGLLKIPS